MERRISVNTGNLLLSLSEITDIANPNIHAHQQRTAFIAMEIANQLGADKKTKEDVFAASLLHDVGAISIEEKQQLHGVKIADPDYSYVRTHCMKGEFLLKKTPWFSDMAEMVLHHHTPIENMENGIEDFKTLGAQIIYLADLIERLIDRNRYVLHQHTDIKDIVQKLGDHLVHPMVKKAFLDLSNREEFWLDLASHRLYSLLLRRGPFRNEQIELKGIREVSEMYKDVIDFKSPFTATHTTGVKQCAMELSSVFGFTAFELELIAIAADFHDIGKLVIPNEILVKQGKLTDEEFAIIKSHTYYTYYVLNAIGGLERIVDIASYHHEKLNGKGYPFKCTSDEIGIGARIMTVADIFTAVAEDRPYRKGMDKDGIYRVFQKNIESHAVDPKMVELLFDDYDRIKESVMKKQAEARAYYQNRFMQI